ncbi:38012_t:CDS:2 [Gigaspora margarita]|uniref:38012_t:CDS:1 n=1 Tax=Gigaspora margarita TaxID=4874 RepID=A0ABN7VAZ9_GIGMA|nr:38012_t:CDS:2 [Gigaspora margarita]
MFKNSNKANVYFLLVKDLLERHKLTVKKKTISQNILLFKYLSWPSNKDRSWIIVTKSLVTKSKNKQYIDQMEVYANETNKFIKISRFDEYHIIEHLKKLIFNDYSESKEISHSEK